MNQKEKEAHQVFVEHVTAVAFHLTLSKGQAALLLFLSKYQYQLGHEMWCLWRDQSGARNDFIGSANGLIRRGLLYHQWKRHEEMTDEEKKKWQYYVVTEQGHLVAKLIEMTGAISKPHVKLKAANS